MGEIELRQPGYVAELIEVFNKAKKNGGSVVESLSGRANSGGTSSFMDGGTSSCSVRTLDEPSHSRTIDDPIHSRATETLSEATSTFSRDLAIALSDRMQQSSSSCLWSSPEGHSDSAEHCSIDVFATLRPPAKCVCVCNEKRCEYVKKHRRKSHSEDWRSPDYETEGRSPHIKKIFTLLRERKSFHQSYELTKTTPQSKWWKRQKNMESNESKNDRTPIPLSPNLLTPVSLSSPPMSLMMDAQDFTTFNPVSVRTNGGSNASPEDIPLRKLEIPTYRPAVDITHTNINGCTPYTADDDDDALSSSESEQRLTPKNQVRPWLEHWRGCKYKPSPFRMFFLVIGSILFLTGISYDFGLKYGVHVVFQNCWNSLADEYISFGNKLMTYNSMFISRRSKRLSDFYSEESDLTFSGTWNNVAEKDPKFIDTLEGLSMSIQLHFFDLVDSLNADKVRVKDLGPLYLRVDFSRERGFRVEYIQGKSNMSLSTTFHVYDLMKMVLQSNDMPHFGFHMKDYHDTTPTALLNVLVDVFKKFKISTSFLESLQNQALWTARKRRSRTNMAGEVLQWKLFEDTIRSVFLSVLPDRHTVVNVPAPALQKNLSFLFEEVTKNSNLECLKFTHAKTVQVLKKTKYVASSIDKWNAMRNKNNRLSVNYRSESVGTSSLSSQHPMVIDLEPTIKSVLGNTKLFGGTLERFPLWISPPHFLSNNDDIPQNSIEGFYSNREQHGSFIYYHPILGVPINASVAFQIGIKPPEKMLYGGKIVPVIWVRLQLEDIPDSLWYLFWFVTHLRVILITVFVCVGLLLITLTATCCCGNKPSPVFV